MDVSALATRVARRRFASQAREACIIAVGDFGGDRCLFKNRDRNYTPELRVYHEVRNGVEVLYIKDEVTGWIEGMNEHGIGVVNAALMVGQDEAEKKVVETVGKKSKDGERVLKVLEQDSLDAAVKSAKSFKGGIKGHTFVSDPDKAISVENTSKHDSVVKTLSKGSVHVRTNHGMSHTDAGYTEGEDYVSSVSRRDQAKSALKGVESPEDIAPAVYGERKGDQDDPNNMVRDTENMRTTSQLVLDLTKRIAHLYLVPKQVKYLGVKKNLPDGHKPKLKLKVYDYTALDKDGDFDVKNRKKGSSDGLLPLLDPSFNVREIVKQLLLLEDHLFQARKRCPDCIWKHLLTAEALAEEAVSLGGQDIFLQVLPDRIREIGRALQAEGELPLFDIAQTVRELRKSLVPVASRMRVAATHMARTEPLDSARVEALRKDFLLIVGNIDRIADVETAEKYRQALQRWHDLLSEYGSQIRSDLEGRVRQLREKDPDVAKWAQYFLDNMKPWWDFVYEVYGPRSLRDIGHTKRNKPWMTEADILRQIAEEGPKWSVRTRRKAQLAWKYLKDVVAWTEKSVAFLGAGGDRIPLVTEMDETLRLEGFQVVFRGFDDAGRPDTDDDLATLKLALRQYRQRAEKVLPLLIQRQLPLVVEWTWRAHSGNAAGMYEYNHIVITPWGLSRSEPDKLVKTLAHEMGHHIYKHFLSSEMQTFWGLAVRGDYKTLDLREALRVMESLGSNASTIDKALAESDPILFLQLGTLMDDPAYKHWDLWNAEAIRDHLAAGKDAIVHVPASPISGYAGKNSEEAFCEAVGLLVAYGPNRLPDKVLGWLKLMFGHQVRFAADRSDPDTLMWVKRFMGRHPTLRHFLDVDVLRVEKPGAGSHPEARYSHRGIELFPKFWSLGASVQDFVFAHEIGHRVRERWSMRSFMGAAADLGVDVWDVTALPFGQGNMDEAFADAFASYFTDGDVKVRYPAWTEIVRRAVGGRTAGAPCPDGQPQMPDGSCPVLGEPVHDPTFAHTASYFSPGDLITFGKWQNKPGKIVRIFQDERGIPMIEIEPVPKGRKQNRTMGLYRIRHADPAKRVASRWAARPIPIDRSKVNDLIERFRRNFEYLAKVADSTKPHVPLGNNPNLMDDIIVGLTDVRGNPLDVIVSLFSTVEQSNRPVLGASFGRKKAPGKYNNHPLIKVELNGGQSALYFARMLPRILFGSLMHELTHAADVVSHEGPLYARPQNGVQPTSDEIDLDLYFNDPLEVRAFMRQIYEGIGKDVRRLIQQAEKPPWAQTLGGILTHLLKSNDIWKMLAPHMTRENKNRILKGLVTAFEDEGLAP